MPLCIHSVNATRVLRYVCPPLTAGTDDVAVTDTVTSGRAQPLSIVPRRKQIAVKTSRGHAFRVSLIVAEISRSCERRVDRSFELDEGKRYFPDSIQAIPHSLKSITISQSRVNIN